MRKFTFAKQEKPDKFQMPKNSGAREGKIGMDPVFHEGVEFGFAIFFEMDQNHAVAATKDRTGLFDAR